MSDSSQNNTLNTPLSADDFERLAKNASKPREYTQCPVCKGKGFTVKMDGSFRIESGCTFGCRSGQLITDYRELFEDAVFHDRSHLLRALRIAERVDEARGDFPEGLRFCAYCAAEVYPDDDYRRVYCEKHWDERREQPILETP